jgi:hypothetical protein
VVGGVKDTAEQWWAVAMTPPINIDTADQMEPALTTINFSLF